MKRWLYAAIVVFAAAFAAPVDAATSKRGAATAAVAADIEPRLGPELSSTGSLHERASRQR